MAKSDSTPVHLFDLPETRQSSSDRVNIDTFKAPTPQPAESQNNRR